MLKIIVILWIHWLSDFCLQSDKIALGKSKSLKILGIHCGIYAIPFLIFGWKFALFNGVLHFIIDFITSKLTSYYWKTECRHAFFVTIGFDQTLHISILLLSLNWLT